SERLSPTSAARAPGYPRLALYSCFHSLRRTAHYQLPRHLRADPDPHRPVVQLILRSVHWLGLEPVFAYLHFDFDRHIERGHAFHDVSDIIAGLVQFLNRYLEDQFVVNLQDHAGFETLFGQSVLDAQHGDLDQVGIATLNGHVDGLAFKRLTLVVGQHMHVGEEALASIERIDITLTPRLIERTLHVVFNARERLMIALDKLASLAIAHASDLGQSKGRLTVEYRVDDRFGQTALILRHLSGGDVKE